MTSFCGLAKHSNNILVCNNAPIRARIIRALFTHAHDNDFRKVINSNFQKN